MKKVYQSLFCGIILLSITSILHSTELSILTEMAARLCSIGDQNKGSSLKIEMKGNGGARIKLFGGISGQAELSKNEWEGMQRVLKRDQLKDNIDYRKCTTEKLEILLKSVNSKQITRKLSYSNGHVTGTNQQLFEIQEKKKNERLRNEMRPR